MCTGTDSWTPGEKKKSNSFLSVAILDHQTHQEPNTCEALSKAAIAAMVRVVCAEGSNKDTWKFSSIQDLREWLKGENPDEIPSEMDAVDVLTLGCRMSPVPIKFLDERAAFHDVAHYRGARRITEALMEDEINVPIFNASGRSFGRHNICRWAYIPIDEKKGL